MFNNEKLQVLFQNESWSVTDPEMYVNDIWSANDLANDILNDIWSVTSPEMYANDAVF